jgi:hypothetical protein
MDKADEWLKKHGLNSEDTLKKQLDKLTSNAATLQHQIFPPLNYVVPALIPEGLSLLAGKPKIGKSFLCLDAALAVAMGGYCLNRLCEQGDVMALFLEDTDRRLQWRTTAMIGAQKTDWPPRFQYATQFPRLDEGGLEMLYLWAKGVESPRLIVIDLWERFRPEQKPKNGSQYSSDYADLARVQKLFSEFPKLGILVTNHQRKATADDVFDTISGTLGLNGGADTLMVLAKDEGAKSLEVRGRDITEYAIIVEQDDRTLRWKDVGAKNKGASTPERKKVVAVLRGKGSMSVQQIAKALGVQNKSKEYDSLKMLLSRMHADEVLVRTGKYGTYMYPEEQAGWEWKGHEGEVH